MTSRGQEQAARMALWLDKHLPTATRIMSSPATRCVETVSALKRNYKLRDELSMNART
ncbi:histidine phosphatase family protein [Burkholderiaceae bacterium]|nr:histidine phosphatase family protein [Burkholderiaceae bacterium]